MKSFALALSCSLLFLSGCGEIEIPAGVPSPAATPIVAPTVSVAVTPTASPLASGMTPDPLASPLPTGPVTIESLTAEKNNLTEAVRVAQTELRDCQIQKNRADALVKNQDSSTAGPANSPAESIVREYLATASHPEFPFDVCGPLGNATSKPWYADFTKALEAKNLSFKVLNRPLKTTDFSRVCASTDGKMAVFLGAQAESKSEFHIVKYSFDTQSIDEAYLVDGMCDTACPNNFGKRRGGQLTLTGQTGNVTSEYQYYYGRNILVKTK
ncbi:MAG: hypothetical protein WCJ84_01190 [Candidatus Peregrinibacteria bacterium]